jgi:uncharacterized protein with FMN-binding domain
MDNNMPASNSSPSYMKFVVPVAVLAIIVITAVFFYTQNAAQTNTSQDATQSVAQEQPAEEEVATVYKDGTYSSVGEYVTPGGERTVDVTVTLQGDVITDTTFVGNATDATSQRFQGEFGDGYKEMVVGKNIDEVAITKVAGSSLTPKGFADALEKIKADAKS